MRMDDWWFHDNLQQVGPTDLLRNHLRQTETGIQSKGLLVYTCFCCLPFAGDEDSRLNLERLGSLGSTSLLQFLPELLGTLTEANKAGEDLQQQFMGECPWFACPASTDIVPRLLGIY